jgi:hypothetical protein
MLDEVLELLPRAALQRIVGRYISLNDVRADPAASRRTLLEDVRAFDAAARAGDYYQSFNVNSKNCMDKSAGTRSFIADFSRLLDEVDPHAHVQHLAAARRAGSPTQRRALASRRSVPRGRLP